MNRSSTNKDHRYSGSSNRDGCGKDVYGGYSHIATNPDVIREKIGDLNNDMQTTLERIKKLEERMKGCSKQNKKKGSGSYSNSY